ncbi:hypothetical protein FYZ48_11970 [Gimesia chilikensis]|uniref:hypothetical protein n=1 Tax=Gimesia chilikensis TaxID=2605989 RepID=UPI0011F06CA0|nr:hypothetical protein [Gimesia chilikensis]KAA0139342.1 hypothetical protein FYZ48_11970 [Gimesia chilikensis]
MRYFYVDDDNYLVTLHSFDARQDQHGSTFYPSQANKEFQRGRPQLSTFRMTTSSRIQEGDAFMVTDEEFNVYECISCKVFSLNGKSIVSGMIFTSWKVNSEDQPSAREKMESALRT